jgi:hypothetical protein
MTHARRLRAISSPHVRRARLSNRSSTADAARRVKAGRQRLAARTSPRRTIRSMGTDREQTRDLYERLADRPLLAAQSQSRETLTATLETADSDRGIAEARTIGLPLR